MSISGIGSSPAAIPAPRHDRDVAARENANSNAPAGAPVHNAVVRAPARAPQGAIPVAAPPGTDPELWSVLTSAERDFFSRNAAQGPLTYSRTLSAQRSPAAPAATARGGRVDVRV